MVIELEVKKYLETKLDVPVLLVKDNNPELKNYCLVEKTGGGGRVDFLYAATITIQSYGETKQKAALLNDLIIDEMQGNGINKFGIASETEVSKCECNSDYDFTDKQRKEYRYQAVFDLNY